MADLYKQLIPRRCATITHYAPPAFVESGGQDTSYLRILSCYSS